MPPRHLVALCLTIAGFAPATALAERVMRPGDMFEIDGRNSVKIISCRDSGPAEKCMVEYHENGQRVGNNTVEIWSVDLRKWETALWASRGKAPPTASGAPQGAAETCPAPPPGPVANSAPAAAATFKRKIYDGYAMTVTGGVSAPLRVGVTFEAFRMDSPVVNTVSNVPGVGATRVTNGAPPNASLVPVSSRHIVCEQYRDGVQKRRVESDYFCFKSAAGDWACGGTGVPRITQLR